MLRFSLGGFDIVTVLTFLAVATFTFLAPVAGYRYFNRSLFVTSLWILVGLMAISTLQMVIFITAIPKSEGGQKAIVTVFLVLKAGIYLTALALFVIGLQTLEGRRERLDRPEREDDEAFAPRPVRPRRLDEGR
jgi:hypothetical protein